MVVYGRKKNENNGRRTAATSARRASAADRAPAPTLTISQEKMETAVVDAVTKKILSSENVALYEAQFRKRSSESPRQGPARR
jgi:hypothetical protein